MRQGRRDGAIPGRHASVCERTPIPLQEVCDGDGYREGVRREGRVGEGAKGRGWGSMAGGRGTSDLKTKAGRARERYREREVQTWATCDKDGHNTQAYVFIAGCD